MRRLPFALALALLVLLPGCLSPEEPPVTSTPPPDATTDDASLRPITQQFTGTVTGTPAKADVTEFPFLVPSGAVGLNGTLSWSLPAARLGLELLDPDGKVVDRGYMDAEGRLVVATVEPPKPGEWKYRVTSTVAVNVSFRLDAVAELIVPADNVDRATRILGARSFYEVNLILEANATFALSFTATGPVTWDIHSHPKSGLKIWEEGKGATGEATFTAPERGVYSVLYENEGATDIEIRYEVTGRFRLHSHSG